MADVLLTMAVVAAAGLAVRLAIKPVLDAEGLRKALDVAVLYILLPAFLFGAVLEAELSRSAFQAACALALASAGTLVLGMFVLGFLSVDARVKGALLLACAFGNVELVGPAALEQLGSNGSAAAWFPAVMTALALVLGTGVACWYSQGGRSSLAVIRSAGAVFKLPPLWAVAAALALRAYAVEVPEWVLAACALLAQAAPGLMILALGTALRIPSLKQTGPLLPPVAIKLLAAPVLALLAARALDAGGGVESAVIVGAALPGQLVTFVIADRFGLDLPMLAAVVAAQSALSYLTVPLMHGLLAG